MCPARTSIHSHPRTEAWLTGGTVGPETSGSALLLVSSVTVGALALARKAGRFAVQSTFPERHGRS